MIRSLFKAVFFDFGGTLFSYRELSDAKNSPVRDSLARLDVRAEPGEVGKAYWKATKEAFEAHASLPFYLHRDLFRDTFARFARELGVEPDAAYLDESVERQRVFMLKTFRLREDCLETLRTLREAGVSLSIVSNIDDDYLDEMVPVSGLDEILHHWSSSEEAASCKPDAGFFHFAMEKAGVAADQVLFVGDSPEHDIAGARAVGMTTVLIRDDENPIASGNTEPHYRIEQLGELLAICGVAPGDPQAKSL